MIQTYIFMTDIYFYESDFVQIDGLNVDRKSVLYALKYFTYQGLKPLKTK